MKLLCIIKNHFITLRLYEKILLVDVKAKYFLLETKMQIKTGCQRLWGHSTNQEAPEIISHGSWQTFTPTINATFLLHVRLSNYIDLIRNERLKNTYLCSQSTKMRYTRCIYLGKKLKNVSCWFLALKTYLS